MWLIYLDTGYHMRPGRNIFIEPPIQQHVADARTHWNQMGTKEWEVMKSKEESKS